MKFKPHYDPGEAVLAHIDYVSSPFRMLRAGMLAGGVSVALYAARITVTSWNTDHYLKSLMRFTEMCQRKWEFSASIADRFTRPGTVFH